MSETEKSNQVKSIVKAFALIEALDAGGALSIGELSTQLGMDKTTVHRIASTLKEAGYVQQDADSKKYANSVKLFEIGQHVIDRTGLSVTARPHMEALAQLTGETVNLALRTDQEIIYIDKIESQSTIKVGINIGTVIPIYCTGMGKALLAFLKEEERSRILREAHFHPFTENTIMDRQVLEEHLSQIRQRGFSMDNEEYVSGLISFGAPVFDHKGNPVAAISVSFPGIRYAAEVQGETYPVMVKETARKISQSLGFRAPQTRL